MSQRDDGKPAARRDTAAALISPPVSLTVSLTLCNFAALAPVLRAPLELEDVY
jgi:hypothetical protein